MKAKNFINLGLCLYLLVSCDYTKLYVDIEKQYIVICPKNNRNRMVLRADSVSLDIEKKESYTSFYTIEFNKDISNDFLIKNDITLKQEKGIYLGKNKNYHLILPQGDVYENLEFTTNDTGMINSASRVYKGKCE